MAEKTKKPLPAMHKRRALDAEAFTSKAARVAVRTADHNFCVLFAAVSKLRTDLDALITRLDAQPAHPT